MIGNKCLLDTSIVIHAFRRHNQISETLDGIDNIYISVTVIGKLYYGAYKSDNTAKQIAQIQAFLNNCLLLPPDMATAIIHGDIKAVLAKKRKPIPENDIWIGAVAIQHNLPLFTTDRHFLEIEG